MIAESNWSGNGLEKANNHNQQTDNMIRIKTLFPLFLMITLGNYAYAQDDLLDQLPKNDESKSYTMASFKSTRLINFHTLEVLGKRSLDFRISHRFGELSSGAEGFYGIDGPASIRLGLEYSHDGRLMAGIGRTSYQKMVDGFLKFRWIRQTEDSKTPVSVTLLSAMYVQTGKDPEAEISGIDKYKYFSNRLSYCHQVIVGRKFNDKLSVQLAPAIVHYNMPETFTDNNDSFHMLSLIHI